MNKKLKFSMLIFCFISFLNLINLQGAENNDIEIYQNIIDDSGVINLEDNTYQEGDLIHLDIIVQNNSENDIDNLKLYSSLYTLNKIASEQYISLKVKGVYKYGTNALVESSFDDQGIIISKIKSQEKLDIKLDIVINAIPTDATSYINIVSINQDEINNTTTCTNNQSCNFKYFKLSSNPITYYQGQDVKISDINIPEKVNSNSSYQVSYKLKNNSDQNITNFLLSDGLVKSINGYVSNLKVTNNDEEITSQIDYYHNYGIVIPEFPIEQEIEISYQLNTKNLENQDLKTIITNSPDSQECTGDIICENIDIKLEKKAEYNKSKYIYIDAQVQNENWNAKVDMDEINNSEVINVDVVVKNMDVDSEQSVLITNNIDNIEGVDLVLFDISSSNNDNVDYAIIDKNILLYNIDVQESIEIKYQLNINLETFKKEKVNIKFKTNDSKTCNDRKCAHLSFANNTFSGTKLSTKLLIVLILVCLMDLLILLGIAKKSKNKN